MKKGYLFIGVLLSVLLFNGCTKSYYRDSKTTTLPFLVNGVQDFIISEARYSYVMDIDVNYNGGDQESVRLSVEGLPSGITARLARSSGYPPLFTSIMFTDSAAAPGVYKVKFVVTGAISGRKEYPIEMTVQETPDCRQPLEGAYNCYANCSPSGTYNGTVVNDPNVAKRIHFTNFEDLGVDVYGTVNCVNGSIVIPRQTSGSYTFQGDGGFAYNPANGRVSISITYQKMTSGGTSSCNLNMNK